MRKSSLNVKFTILVAVLAAFAIFTSGLILNLEAAPNEDVSCRQECTNGGYVTCEGEFEAGSYSKKDDEGCMCDGKKFSCNNKEIVKHKKKDKKKKKKKKKKDNDDEGNNDSNTNVQ